MSQDETRVSRPEAGVFSLGGWPQWVPGVRFLVVAARKPSTTIQAAIPPVISPIQRCGCRLTTRELTADPKNGS